MSTTIPEYVATYALGLRHASVGMGGALPWPRIAQLIEALGFGSFHAGELERASLAWERDHVAGDHHLAGDLVAITTRRRR